MDIPVVGFEIFGKQVVFGRIEHRGQQRPHFFGQRVADIRGFKIDFHCTCIGQAGSFAQEQTASATFQLRVRITERQRPGLGSPMIKLDIVFVAQTVSGESMDGVGNTIGGGAAGPPEQRRNQTTGIASTIGQSPQRPHLQQGGPVGVNHIVRQRMGNSLIGADLLAKRLAFTGIDRSHFDCLARQAGQRGRGQQLPLLDTRSPDCRGIGVAGQYHALALARRKYAQRGAAQSQWRIERCGRNFDGQVLSVKC